MHTLFLLSALLLAAALSGAGVILLRLAPAGGRRPLALAVLAAPPVVLAMATFHIVPRFWPECAPLAGWDQVASLGLLVMLAGTAVGALGVNLARLVLVERLLAVCRPLADEALTALLATLARRLGVAPPVLRVLGTDGPLAVSGGLWRPTVVLSSWLVEQLDRREMEGVLAHELAHLARRDHLTRWVGRLLRDATIYLPGGWYAWRVLEADEELVADAMAVEATGRPLAMVSALGKVWRGAGLGPADLAGLAGYAGTSAALLEERLDRLLHGRALRASPLPSRLLAGANLVLIGDLAPRLLMVTARALPHVCNLRPF